MKLEVDYEREKAFKLACECGSIERAYIEEKYKTGKWVGELYIERWCKNCGKKLGMAAQKVDKEKALETTMPFGKYRNKLVKDIIKQDPEYIKWLVEKTDNKWIKIVIYTLMKEEDPKVKRYYDNYGNIYRITYGD